MRPRTCCQALSLLETVAVVGLVTLVILFSLGLIPSFKMSNRRANMELQAGSIAQSALDEQRAKAFGALASVPPADVNFDGQTYRLEIIVSPGASADTRRVRARVTWSWKERNMETFRESVVCRVPRS